MSEVSGANIYACVPGPNHVRSTYLERSKVGMTNTHVIVNKIQSCDLNREVLKVMRLVYDHMIVLRKYC